MMNNDELDGEISLDDENKFSKQNGLLLDKDNIENNNYFDQKS